MNVEKLSRYALLLIGTVAAGAIVIILAKYALPVISPFVLAWLAAMAANRPANRLSGQIHVPVRIIRLMISILLVVALFLLISLLIWQTTVSLGRFLSDMGDDNRLYVFLNTLTLRKGILGKGISDELAAGISNAVDGMVTSALSRLGDAVTGAVSSVPKIFFYLIVTLISLFYFSLDLEGINRTVTKLLPDSLCKRLRQLRDGMFFVIRRYLRSYLILMAITYFIILIGLLLLGVRHATIISLVIALLDILPVIGVGTVLVPWAVIEISVGGRLLGIGLLILFMVNTLIRQLIEPKIVGKNLDIHPILTLIMLYVGYSLFGVTGLILLPVITVSISEALRKNDSTEVG